MRFGFFMIKTRHLYVINAYFKLICTLLNWILPKRVQNISSETGGTANLKSGHFVLFYDV